MKLRLRFVQSEETVKKEVPTSVISSHYTFGDLVYCSVNPIDFSPSGQYLCLDSSSSVREQARGHRGNVQGPTPDQLMTREPDLFVRGHVGVQANDANSQETKPEISPDMLVQGHNGEHEIGESDMNDVDTERHGSLDPKAQSGETLETQELTSVEAMDIDTGSADVDGKRVSELYFMRKLLMKEMGDDGNSYKFLDIAVHAVFIESGFGGINFISGKVDGFHLTEEQASKNLAISEAQGIFNVYGCLAKDASEIYRACFDVYIYIYIYIKKTFAPTIDFVWADGKNDGMNGNDGSSMLYVENENCVFWSGSSTMLDAPPTELKLKILESLAAIDIAKMEHAMLVFKNDLWQQKFAEGSGDGIGTLGTVNWKEQFASYWENKKWKRTVNAWQDYQEAPPVFFRIRCDPHPFRFPSFIGGDYDHRPVLGIPPLNGL
uniref:F-box domain-containing protein n=2 Tax=Salix viminalis TaxID=40686 RepID=A0A6N2LMD3_SALVM